MPFPVNTVLPEVAAALAVNGYQFVVTAEQVEANEGALSVIREGDVIIITSSSQGLLPTLPAPLTPRISHHPIGHRGLALQPAELWPSTNRSFAAQLNARTLELQRISDALLVFVLQPEGTPGRAEEIARLDRRFEEVQGRVIWGPTGEEEEEERWARDRGYEEDEEVRVERKPGVETEEKVKTLDLRFIRGILAMMAD